MISVLQMMMTKRSTRTHLCDWLLTAHHTCFFCTFASFRTSILLFTLLSLTMSWFRNSKASNNDKARKKHITSLMSRNGRSFTVAQSNRNQYQISFRTRMGTYSFTVLLSDQFPESPPRLFGEARFSHPGMDQNGNLIAVKELNSWSPNTSDLGRVVQSAVTQFVASPPVLRQGPPVQHAPQVQAPYHPPQQQQAQKRPSGYQPVRPLQDPSASKPAPPCKSDGNICSLSTALCGDCLSVHVVLV